MNNGPHTTNAMLSTWEKGENTHNYAIDSLSGRKNLIPQ